MAAGRAGRRVDGRRRVAEDYMTKTTFVAPGGECPTWLSFLERVASGKLANIIRAFNDQFGNIDWKDSDKIRQVIAEEIPAKVSLNKAYQNAMKNSDRQNARIEHDNALQRVIAKLLADHAELFKQFSDNPSFKEWLGDSNFAVTYNPGLTPQNPASPAL